MFQRHESIKALVSIIFSLASLLSFAAQPEKEDSCVFLTDMAAIVMESSGKENYMEVPSVLMDIIEDYYAETIIPNQVATEVLTGIENIYREHGYRETGNWVEASAGKRYNPYPGELPHYEDSEFQVPISGKLTSRFGYRPLFRRLHKGIDISLNIGDTVKCSLPGVVVKTGYERGGYGRYVLVAHAGNIETLYAHLNYWFVRPGQKLEAGAPIGLGGRTGNSTGPHLHFETRYLGVAVDPVNWFEQYAPER